MFAGLMLLSSLSGISLARTVRWQATAVSSGVISGFGLCLGPFLAGLAAVVVLTVLPGAAVELHIGVAYAAIALLGLVAIPAWKRQEAIELRDQEVGSWLILAMAGAWALSLVVYSINLPLFENDSLEYATYSRLLLETRSILTYPALDPSIAGVGFYHPITHPPLYPAFIYLSSALEGTTATPGIMRLITAWFALAGVWLVMTLGLMRSAITGAAAALVMISTPLFYQGASASLIDALPAAGVALILAALAASKGSAVSRGILVGCALGCALWTHSQAVLLIPIAIAAIMLQWGYGRWKKGMTSAATAVLVCLVFAVWPYLRNTMLFGSPVSDNPLVFSLPNLAWDDYFRIARGIDSPMAGIQYGIFKGWFSPYSFGIAFWMMSGGIAILLLGLGREGLRHALAQGNEAVDAGSSALMTSFYVVVIYLAGVTVSLSLGMDIMIKNDRYLLIILPPVALLAGECGRALLGWMVRLLKSPTRWLREVSAMALFVLTFGLAGSYLLLGVYLPWSRFGNFGLPVGSDGNESRERKMLAANANMQAMFWLEAYTPSDATVLAMRPADMYYSGRRMVSFVDPDLVPFYTATSADQAAAELRRLGVSYIQAPDYYIPTMYNSRLQQLMADPELTALVFDDEGVQIYHLAESGRSIKSTVNVSPDMHQWYSSPQILLLGRSFSAALMDDKPVPPGGISSLEMPMGILNRDVTTVLSLGPSVGYRQNYEDLPLLQANSEYRLNMRFSGRGYVRVFIYEHSEDASAQPQPYRLGEVVLSEEKPEFDFERRFLTSSTGGRLGIEVQHVGNSTLGLTGAILERLE